jgi:hypothetical protein
MLLAASDQRTTWGDSSSLPDSLAQMPPTRTHADRLPWSYSESEAAPDQGAGRPCGSFKRVAALWSFSWDVEGPWGSR